MTEKDGVFFELPATLRYAERLAADRAAGGVLTPLAVVRVNPESMAAGMGMRYGVLDAADLLAHDAASVVAVAGAPGHWQGGSFGASPAPADEARERAADLDCALGQAGAALGEDREVFGRMVTEIGMFAPNAARLLIIIRTLAEENETLFAAAARAVGVGETG